MSSVGPLSRRVLLGQAAAGLALAPHLARADTGTLIPPSQASPIQPVENIQAGLDAQSRMTVDAMVNGKGPFRFVVDTGADRSVISEELAKALALPAGEDLIVAGIARSVPAPSAKIASLQIGRVQMTDLVLPALPGNWLGGDGYLGLDVIDNQAVTFDFKNRRIAVAPSGTLNRWTPVADDAVVRANGENGRLIAVRCTVEGMSAHAFIDSGAQISIGNTALFSALASQGARYMNDRVVQLLGVTGGAAPGRIMAIDAIKLGPIRFSHNALVISDIPIFKLWDLDDKPALFIGMNFLRQTSAVTIDYGRKEMRFKIAENTRLARNA